jgi:peptide/nickel transport system substrate-binding protein
MSGNLKSGYWERPIRRRALVRGAALLGAAAGVTSLAGCSSAGPSAVATSPPAGSPQPPSGAAVVTTPAASPSAKRGGTFHVLSTSDPPNLDPHTNVSLTLFVQGPAVAYSKLLQYKADRSVKLGEYVPTGDLAESWEQPDETTYVFKLRPSAKWHNIAPVNGRPVVAEDIRYSYERQVALKTNAPNLAAVSKVEAVDPRTLKLVLAQPDADFLITLADTRNKIVAREAVELRGNLEEPPVIGSSAWIFERWDKGTTAGLRKNPDYYVQGLPYVDRIDFPRVPDPGTAETAFRAQQLDVFTAVTPRDADRIAKTNQDIVRQALKIPNGTYLGVNASKPPFTDIRVRQAIWKAIDKQRILDTLYDGQAWLYPGARMPRDDYYLPEAEVRELFKQDVPAAKRLLGEAGLAAGAEFELMALQIGASVVDIAQLVKADLDAVGIRVTIRAVDTPIFVSTVYTNGTHDMCVSSTTPVQSTNGDLFNVHHSKGVRSAGKLKDPKLDEMIEKQATLAKDPDGRKKLLQDIQRYLINSAHQNHLVGTFKQVVRWKYLQDYFFASNDLEEAYAYLWLDK